MRLLIYGSEGWIGKQFIEILDKNNIQYIKGNSRTNNKKTLENEIDYYKPTSIISFIGRTHGYIGKEYYSTIDYLEQKGKLQENIRDNLYSPLLLAHLSNKKNIHYTYLGTGCIFNYDDNHICGKEENGFTESDLPNFFGSSYSIVKGYTDQIMNLFDNVLNLRIRMPITHNVNPRNFITKITNYKKICSMPNSMTVLPELLPKLIDMINMKITGTINFTNPGLISHNEILNMFKDIVDPEFTWNNFSIQEQSKILSSERSNNYLDTNKLQRLFPDIKNIKDSIKECLIKYSQSYSNYKLSHNISNQSSYLNKQLSGSIDIDKDIDKNIIEDNYINSIKNLLVTGGAGFIGSSFINYFSHKYPHINIINVDKLYYCANINNIDNDIRNSDNYKFIQSDINNQELIIYILEQNCIDTVIHFAAQSHVQNSFDDSLQFTKDNVFGTHSLLESCRIYNKIKKFIHVSTDEVYGESMNDINEKSKTEHSVLVPTNPYAATKAGAELLVQSYSHSYKMPIIITRGNNVYGPNQYPEKVIPKFIKLLNQNKKITIQGDGTSVRAFLFSLDTVKAFESILNKGRIGEIYNIGCDDNMEYSILDLAKLLIKKIKNTDNYHEWIEYIDDRPFNDRRYYISNQKLKSLGWKIETNLKDGLSYII